MGSYSKKYSEHYPKLKEGRKPRKAVAAVHTCGLVKTH